MIQVFLSRQGGAVLVAALLAGLAAAAPAINQDGRPPRAVFLQLPDHLPEPEVSLRARQLPSGRWRLEIAASDFRFTELCLAEAPAVPIGHAHVILNGEKVASAYQPVVDLGELAPGRHRIAAVLRGQDHRALVGESGLIMAELTVTVPAR